MDHRHLHPNEFDLLLDGDVGFGLAPLKAHVRQCAECRAELEEGRRVMAALDELPHFAPSPLFTERVMARVEIHEPWHVTLRDTVMGLVPRSRPARVLAGAGALAVALLVSTASVLVLGRLDIVLFGWGWFADRGRALAVDVIGGTLTAVFGEPAVRALATASHFHILLGAVLFLASLVAAALLLRTAALASTRGQRG
ncbi:MAG TPA: hypothetical protein VGE02_07755 [Gemmatimonadales bacterium]